MPSNNMSEPNESCAPPDRGRNGSPNNVHYDYGSPSARTGRFCEGQMGSRVRLGVDGPRCPWTFAIPEESPVHCQSLG
ncbi:hypothetical protein EVAR_657_1 [Eumeta japonica]|uniref:Uncharacterized protein n=1 Tax=Eumeta variegata TaxID=151549 RepID=A0A4C1SDJ8_EUMVA|nr:hypothetical protein EVAR_657_1 [Eumeta japonica]